MKKHKWLWFAVAVMVIAVCLVINPKFRAELFVSLYHQEVEEGLRMQEGVPGDDVVFLGYKSVNTWEGEHPMTEFVLMTRGDTYYGVYYSPEDVPVAFQNVDVPLTQDGHDYWTWTGEGDNHGATSKLRDHWYYFEAGF